MSKDIDVLSEADIAELYEGSSEGADELFKGYVEYALETIRNRALPDVRDGLKPVQRRILWGMHSDSKKFSKNTGPSILMIGAISPIHPHGDSSIYEAAALMSEANGSWNIPVLASQGNLGAVSGEGPAQPRYSHLWLGKNSKDYFSAREDAFVWKEGEAEGIDYEPSYLPVRYPAVLCNSQKGIAVGMTTYILGYNFWDVIELTEKWLKGEDIYNKILIPDVPTGGFVINNQEQFAKIMATGRGTVRVRARVEIDGDTLVVSENPYGKTTDSIVLAINDIINGKTASGRAVKQNPNIRKVVDLTDLNHSSIEINCRHGAAEDVLKDLYRRNILETNCSVRMMFMDKDVPLTGGMKVVLESWYKGRERVLKNSFEADLKDYEESYKNLEWFIRLLNNRKACNEYVNKLVNATTAEASGYLREVLEGIPDERVDWISRRRATEFNKASKYQAEFEAIEKAIQDTKYNLAHLKEYVINDLENLKKEHAGEFNRISEVTNTAYKFVKVKEERVKADKTMDAVMNGTAESVGMYYTVTKDGLFYKTREAFALNEGNILYRGVLKGNDILIGFDNAARIIRVYGDQIPITGIQNPINLADYTDVPEELQSAWRLMYITKLEGQKDLLLYKDGKVGWFDTEPFTQTTKRVRVKYNGLPEDIEDSLLEVIPAGEVPQFMVVADQSKGGRMRFGWYPTGEISETKSSKSRVRPIQSTNFIFGWGGFNNHEELLQTFGDELPYAQGRARVLGNEETVDKLTDRLNYGSYLTEEELQ